MVARLQTVEEVFHAALDQEPPEVAALLDEQCADDESLRREVEALLTAHRQAGNFIETPIVTLDPGLFEDEPADRLIGQTIGHYQITKTNRQRRDGRGLSRPAGRPAV